MEKFMRKALAEAQKAATMDEVPVGAVVVKDGKAIARAHNLKVKNKDAFAHAEMLAMSKAQKKLGDWRLNECDLYVTLEPCPMCAGAIINARVKRVVFGASDPKAGCTGTLYNLPEDKRFNHRAEIVGGVMAKECGEILTSYFRAKRQ